MHLTQIVILKNNTEFFELNNNVMHFLSNVFIEKWNGRIERSGGAV